MQPLGFDIISRFGIPESAPKPTNQDEGDNLGFELVDEEQEDEDAGGDAGATI
jgi:hypothetical protein